MKKFLLPITVCLLVLALCFSAAALDTVYVNDGGSGDGSSAEAPMGSLYDAINAVAKGGSVVIVDTLTLDEPFTEPAHDLPVTISGGKLVFNNAKTSRYFLNGPTTFEKMTFTYGSANTAKSGLILARFYPITMGEGITSSGFTFYVVGGYQDPSSESERNLDSSVTVKSGTYTAIVGFSRGSGTVTFRGTSNITIDGGTIKSVYGASINGSYSGSTNITVNGGTVTSLYTGGDSTRRLNGNAKVTINGGTVSSLNVNNVMGHTDVYYLGGNVGSMSKSVADAITHEITDGTASLIVRKGLAAHEFIEVFDDATYEDGSKISSAADAAVAVFTVLDKVPEESNVTAAKIYVSNAGSGDGLTPETAMSDLAAAFEKLEGIDGTIVLVNDYPLDAGSFYEPEHENTIVITSYDGERYFDGGLYFCGAKLNRYYLSGNTVFENTEISLTSAPLFICRWNDITFGKGMEMPENKLYVVGGYQFGTTDPIDLSADGTITVKSGSYYCLIGYTRGIPSGDQYVFSGIQTINILGDASVYRVYGGPAQANQGSDIVINIDGGKVTNFIQLGGDNYYNSNNAVVNMKSGSVAQLDMRNLLVSATVNWTGGEIGSIVCDNCIYNNERNEEAYAAVNEYKDTTYTLNYAGVTPTAEMLAFFDKVTNDVAATSTEVKMTIGQNVGYINGEAKPLDAAPIIRESRTMLPVRFVAEAFGAEIGWDGATSTATVKTADVTIEITIGATTAKVNGVEVTLDAPAFIENSRTYMPVRFVAENLGATVAWDGATSTATLTK